MLIRHYFPAVDISKLSDDEYYGMLADVEWLENRKQTLMANAIARAFGGE